MPSPDGAGTPVVLVASVVCGRCGEWAVAWGVGVDGLEDVEVVGLCGALVPDRKLKQAFIVDCFDDIVLLMPLLAPPAS